MSFGTSRVFCLLAIGLLCTQHAESENLRKRSVSKMMKSMKSQSIIFGGETKTAADVNACAAYGYEENLATSVIYNDFFEYLNKLQVDFARSIYNAPDYSSKLSDGQSYDVIIVGGGLSGSLMAKLLAKSGYKSILMIEAGSDAPLVSYIPAMWSEIIQDSKYDWGFVLEDSEDYGLGMKDKRIRLNQARVMGGSSAINDMIHDRGSALDYERWESLNLTGWSYSEIDAIYQKIESVQFESNIETQTTTEVGDGYITITTVTTEKVNLLRNTFTRAFEEIGFHSPQLFTVSDHVGVAPPQYYLKDGQRMLASNVLLRSIKNKDCLKVAKNSEVTKICFDDSKTRATGVEIKLANGKLIKVKANQEVILAAGSINSPRILQHSGVGDAALLSKYKIPVVKNLPGVGKRLNLHPMFVGLMYTFTKTPVSAYTINEIIYDYLTERSGRFTDMGMSNFVGYLDTDFKDNPDVAVTQYYFPAQDILFLRGQLKAWNLNDDLVERIVKVNMDKPVLIIGLVVLGSNTEGTVEIVSSDPTKNPRISYPLYSKEEDIKNILTAVNMVDKVMKYKDFNNFDTQAVRIEVEECAKCKYASEEYYRCAIKYFSTTTSHPTGTLRMGPSSDPLSVVNADFKVCGFKNLRAIGEPVIPVNMVTDSSAVALMLAERCAQFMSGPQIVKTKTTIEETEILSE